VDLVDKRVRRLVLSIVAAAVLLTVAAYVFFPVRASIGGTAGLVYWTGATLAASALPVRLPRGTVVSVAAAPLIATFILGGPVAGAVVALIGTTEAREVRGEVPWYGSIYNHAATVISVVLGGIIFELLLPVVPSGPIAGPIALLAFTLIASAAYFILNWTLAIAAVSARTGVSIASVWAQDVGGVASTLAGLAPLAWLMATVFQLPDGVGWWATALFVVPLLTTRLAYARYVETRELFEQTIEALSKAVDAETRTPATTRAGSATSPRRCAG
jgi:MFS family permease